MNMSDHLRNLLCELSEQRDEHRIRPRNGANHENTTPASARHYRNHFGTGPTASDNEDPAVA
jgi:hypothetical protein